MKRVVPVLILLALSACRPVRMSPGPGEAICPVCAYTRDLACVCLKVTAETPRQEYRGETYSFCSEHCRKEFRRDPEKYRQAVAAPPERETGGEVPNPPS